MNLLKLSTIVFILITLGSCSKEPQLEVSENTILQLKSFVDRANALSNLAENLDPNLDSFFNDAYEITSSGCCVTYVPVGGINKENAELLIEEFLTKINFESPKDVQDWMSEAGKVIYNEKENNKNIFNVDHLLINELASELQNEANNGYCHHSSLTRLLSGALYSYNPFELQNPISEETYTIFGSSLHKVWIYIDQKHKCNTN